MFLKEQKIYDTIKVITQGQCESLTDKKDTGSLQIKPVSFLFFVNLKNIEK